MTQKEITMQTYDIAIVGSGLVGGTLAAALADLPLRVVLIDAKPAAIKRQLDFDTRSIALAHGSQRILETLGVWQKLVGNFQPIEHIHVSEKGRFGFTRLSAEEFDLASLGYVVEAPLLAGAITDHLAENFQGELLCPAEVTAIHRVSKGFELQLKQDDQSHQLHCQLLIAADGAHSSTCRALGLQQKQTAHQQQALVSNVGLGRHHQQTAYERFTAQGPMAFLPLRDQRAAMICVLPPEQAQHAAAMPESEFLRFIQKRFGYRLGRFNKIGKRMTFPLVSQRVDQQIGDRFVVMGNAAHFLHPIAGQGLNLSLRDVALLAEILAEAVMHGKAWASEKVLQQYVNKRLPDQANIISFTNFLQQIFVMSLTPVAWMRNSALVGIDRLPKLKKHLAQHTLGLAGASARLTRGLSIIPRQSEGPSDD